MKRYLIALFVFGLSLSGFGQAQCATFPCVVATTTLIAQGQAIPSTPIFTPTANGIFRISAYMSTSPGTNNAYWSIYLGWTDSHGFKKAYSGGASQNQASTYPAIVVQDFGGQPLLYQTILHGGGGGSGGMTYDLIITVEQLQ